MAGSIFDLDNQMYKEIGKDRHLDQDNQLILKRSETIGKIITKLRLDRGYTQQELSDSIGIAQQTYGGYEKGRHEPSVEILIRLADIYNISMDFITGRYISTTNERIKDQVLNEKIEQADNEDVDEKILLHDNKQRGKYNRAKKKKS